MKLSNFSTGCSVHYSNEYQGYKLQATLSKTNREWLLFIKNPDNKVIKFDSVSSVNGGLIARQDAIRNMNKILHDVVRNDRGEPCKD